MFKFIFQVFIPGHHFDHDGIDTFGFKIDIRAEPAAHGHAHRFLLGVVRALNHIADFDLLHRMSVKRH